QPRIHLLLHQRGMEMTGIDDNEAGIGHGGRATPRDYDDDPAIAAARRCKRTAILKSDRTVGDELNNDAGASALEAATDQPTGNATDAGAETSIWWFLG